VIPSTTRLRSQKLIVFRWHKTLDKLDVFGYKRAVKLLGKYHFLVGCLLVLSLSCATEVIDDSSMADLFPDFEQGLGGKTDNGVMTESKRDILLRMRARYDEMRVYKADGTMGESAFGYVTIPGVALTEDALKAKDQEYQDSQAALIEAENADRSAYYDIIQSQYQAQVVAQLEEQMPTIRAEVVAALCAGLPAGTPCDTIADAVIKTALDEAMVVTIDELMLEIRTEVELTHGAFWQDRTCKRGEWIEVDTADGYAWRKK
jgi:hypothetical protein